MPTQKIPSYRRHKASGQGIVTLTDASTGARKDVLLGKYGTKASRVEYSRVIQSWEACGRRLAPSIEEITIHQLAAAYMQHARVYYRTPDGRATGEIEEYARALRPVVFLFGSLPAKDYGPLALESCRQLLITGYHHPKYDWQEPLARSVINQRIGRIKRVFAWGVAKEMVPPSVAHGLACVRGLRAGRSAARETKPVKPVSEHMVEAAKPYMSATVRAMVDVQLLTGARPGEICAMRGCDIDMSGRVWVYRPTLHKNAWRGQQREIYVGPKAQEILKPLLRLNTEEYLFRPDEAEAERRRVLRAKRKTRVQPSQRNRRKKRPRRKLSDRYDVQAYSRSITYACDRAFPPPEHLGKREGESGRAWKARLTEQEQTELEAWRKDHRWRPHRLRHSAATRLRKEYGVELARIILGHKTAFTTEIYAEADRAQAAQVMGKIG